MTRLIAAVLAAALFCAGCLTATTERTAENAAVAEALLTLTGTRAQGIAGSWKDRCFAAECVMKGDGETFRAVFLAPQMRLGTVVVRRGGALVWERDRTVPEALDPERLLFDLACVNLPADVLAKALAPAYRVEERGGVRRVLTVSGELVCTRATLADGALKFECPRYGYGYTVRPASTEED